MSTITRVFLVDDHAVLRTGLRILLSAQKDIEVVGEASDGLEAISKVDECKPDIIILDLTMPRLGGLDTLAKLRNRYPYCKVLVLTMHKDENYLRRALSAGAMGYVLKQSDDQELMVALRAVARGEIYVPPALAPYLLSGIIPNAPVESSEPAASVLSDREEQVIRRVAQGYTSPEIAEQLHLAVTSVETYRSRAMNKLGLRGRVELVQYALKVGWLKEE